MKIRRDAEHCFRLIGGHGVIRSLSIHGCGSHPVVINGSHLNNIEGCWIGLDATAEPRGNGGYGVIIDDSANNVVGGWLEVQRNVIGANTLG